MEPPDSIHLQAAEGWIGLGDFLAANEELDAIAPEKRALPEVLVLRGQIFKKAGKWGGCLEIGSHLVLRHSNCADGFLLKAEALHQLGKTREARDCLLNGIDSIP